MKIIACAGWAYTETISSLAEHTQNRFHRTLSLSQTNFSVCSASFQILTVFTRTSNACLAILKRFNHLLSIRGNNFIACWAYEETISSLVEHKRKWFHRWNIGEIFYKLTFQDRLRAFAASSQPILSSELCNYEILTLSIQSYLARSHYTWAFSMCR